MRCNWLTLAYATLALALPGAAAASPSQISILHDDANLIAAGGERSDAAMAEAKALGVDQIRSFLTWNRVAPEPTSRTVPTGFDPANPNSPGYDWAAYDALVERARQHGLKVSLTLAPPLPYWASDQPSKCPHRTGGYRFLHKSCHWKPNVAQFAAFARAAATRFGTDVEYWSIWNEPNLEHYLYPQYVRGKKTYVVGGKGRVDFAARRYRELFAAGQRAIAEADPDSANKVLFGETAAISSPMDTLFGALCLDENGKPFTGGMRRAMGCTKPRKLNIGGIAVHPYNSHASGSVFTKSFTRDGLPPAYLSRLHRVARIAERRGRIPRGRGFFVTESGFQSSPPDRKYGLGLEGHARALNEFDRLLFADKRIRSTAQFEIYDVPTKANEHEGADVYTTGLRTVGGEKKPAWDAYRMPLVATRLGGGQVEVWGQVRPADGPVEVNIQAAPPGDVYEPVATARTNASGYFRFRFRRGDATRIYFRSEWTSPAGELMKSRDAFPGPRIRYLEPVNFIPPPPKESSKRSQRRKRK